MTVEKISEIFLDIRSAKEEIESHPHSVVKDGWIESYKVGQSQDKFKQLITTKSSSFLNIKTMGGLLFLCDNIHSKGDRSSGESWRVEVEKDKIDIEHKKIDGVKITLTIEDGKIDDEKSNKIFHKSSSKLDEVEINTVCKNLMDLLFKSFPQIQPKLKDYKDKNMHLLFQSVKTERNQGSIPIGIEQIIRGYMGV